MLDSKDIELIEKANSDLSLSNKILVAALSYLSYRSS